MPKLRFLANKGVRKMRLEEHLQIIKALPIRNKRSILRILWTIFQDHHNELANMGFENFIKAVTIPFTPKTPKTIIGVKELVAKRKLVGKRN